MNSERPKATRFLPLALDVRGMKCVVVGGGTVGSRKALTLTRAGARVTVVAPELTDDVKSRLHELGITWINKGFSEEHLESAFLVVAATPDKILNATVARLGREHNALVCDASSAGTSQVIFGALLHVDNATIAVFTDGRDPARARSTRDEIAGLLSLDGNHGK
jgi:siroheme synthase-like protein